ncbi:MULTISPECIES: leucyl aminopeptidase family protein [Sporosarcina]|uniref:Probable cytosol aminopeptidase n=1 Tax=Sporosarcina contaminans TaxID=633403 RepID=A0ABW3U5Q7_9BACL
MSNVVNIIYAQNEKVTGNAAVQQYVDQQQAAFCSVLIGDVQYVVLKEQKKPSLEKVRSIAGDIARHLSEQKIVEAVVSSETLKTAFANLDKNNVSTAFAEGWDLGSYQFLNYKTKEERSKTELQVDGEEAKSYAEIGKIRAAATAFSRDLMNEVSNVLNPETYPEVLKMQLEDKGIEVTVFDQEKIEEMEMNGVLTVGRGSKYKPSFVELRYKGDETKPLLALVGKGVTFDTGGISLKSGKDLSDMRMDMGGSAAVAGAMQLLAETKAQVNVVALIPMVENTIDNTAVLPGEVIHYKNGLTVQIGNTDAEGRLILADALIRAGELNAEYIVDIATLTGAIVNALGTALGGVFGDEELSYAMKKIGDENGDFVWPMPLVEEYDKTLSSDYADMNNISSLNFGGSITAALFLRRFVPEGSKWLHVDMAGMMSKSKPSGYYAKSATGYGARLLADYAVKISE